MALFIQDNMGELLLEKQCFTSYLYGYYPTSLINFGSRPIDHYFRSVCLFVCAEFFSAVFDPIWIKLGYMLHVWV